MRILHVIPSLAPRYGGPSKDCAELCRELARRGIRVSIYTTNIDGKGYLDVRVDTPVWNDGVECRYFPVQRPRSFVFSLPLARALKAAVPKFDLVHIHSLYLFPSTVAAHYCRRYGVPYLIKPHGSLDPYIFRRHRGRKWIYDQLFEWRNLNRAAAIHFTTLEEQALTHPLGVRAPGLVVPVGVHLHEFLAAPPPGAFRAAYPETQGKRIILFLGRLNFKKGLDLLTKAFGEIARRRNDVHLMLVGPDNDDYAVNIRRWLRARDLLGRATFAGMLSGPKKLAAFRDADVFVLPSYTENFGIAVVEAMASSLPVVISNKVNIWSAIADARAGLVVDCDVEQLSEAVLTVLDDPVLGREMGQRGRRLVEERFTREAVAEQMMQEYRRILARHSPTSVQGAQGVREGSV